MHRHSSGAALGRTRIAIVSGDVGIVGNGRYFPRAVAYLRKTILRSLCRDKRVFRCEFHTAYACCTRPFRAFVIHARAIGRGIATHALTHGITHQRIACPIGPTIRARLHVCIHGRAHVARI